MSVCYIGVLQNDIVKYIGCTYGGELMSVGVRLQLAYNSIEKIQALLNLGYIQSLGYNVDAPKKFNDALEAQQCYKYCLLHTKTSFTLAWVRDLNDRADANAVQECSVGHIGTTLIISIYMMWRSNVGLYM